MKAPSCNTETWLAGIASGLVNLAELPRLQVEFVAECYEEYRKLAAELSRHIRDDEHRLMCLEATPVNRRDFKEVCLACLKCRGEGLCMSTANKALANEIKRNTRRLAQLVKIRVLCADAHKLCQT
jgi:hypothetical protein